MTKPAPATFVESNPVVAPIAQMELMPSGVVEMMRWLQETNPACLPEDLDLDDPPTSMMSLFPHLGLRESGHLLTDNELLVEFAGRKCYNSFGDKAGRKTNKEYIENTQDGDIPHASIMYHAKMAFFIAGVSRRVSHELILHYVGADRDEEGSPSQESTRYVEHNGRYVVHPGLLNDERGRNLFHSSMVRNREQYLNYIEARTYDYKAEHGEFPKGMDRKRIFESASSFLSHSAETSFVWTTNPVALAKLIRERKHEAADLEFQRLARVWRAVALKHWPNLFPQPWMRVKKTKAK